MGENNIKIRSEQGTAFAWEEELGFPWASRKDGCGFPHKL